MASHLQLNSAFTTTRTQLVELLVKHVKACCSFANWHQNWHQSQWFQMDTFGHIWTKMPLCKLNRVSSWSDKKTENSLFEKCKFL